jgi:hypothetical protein
VRRLLLAVPDMSPCLSRGRLFCRLAGLRQRLFEFLFDAERVGGGTCPKFPQGMAIALAAAGALIALLEPAAAEPRQPGSGKDCCSDL